MAGAYSKSTAVRKSKLYTEEVEGLKLIARMPDEFREKLRAIWGTEKAPIAHLFSDHNKAMW